MEGKINMTKREQFLEWNLKQKNPLPPMTRTQSEFFDFIIENLERLPAIGNIETIFHYVVKFNKEND